MTEDDAKTWCAEKFDARANSRLANYVRLLLEEVEKQNLISAATVPMIWERHIVDSAQLVDFLSDGPVVDIGSGAGLPGLVLACLGIKVTLVEPRRQRADFLTQCVDALKVDADVQQVMAVAVCGTFANITARAVSKPLSLIAETRHLARPDTRWVLPAGRSAWTTSLPGVSFHVEQSVTDRSAGIIIAQAVGDAG